MFWYVWITLAAILLQRNALASDKIIINYTIWLDPEASKSASITLTAHTNETFYNVMKRAAAQDTTFKFEAEQSAWGHYVTKISGIEQDLVDNFYWMIHLLPHAPNPNKKPDDSLLSTVGVDSIKMQKGVYYLFWYKHVPVKHTSNKLKSK